MTFSKNKKTGLKFCFKPVFLFNTTSVIFHAHRALKHFMPEKAKKLGAK